MDKRLIKQYYSRGFYSDKNLETFVQAGFLTESEKEDIQRCKVK